MTFGSLKIFAYAGPTAKFLSSGPALKSPVVLSHRG